MTWLVVKKALKKTWVWLKHNWYIPAVLVYTVVLWIFFRRKDKAHDVLKVRSKSYEAQIEAINKSHAEEIEKRDEILKQYNETINRLEEEFERKNKELDNKKRKAVKEIVEKHYNDPDALARMLSEKFGFEHWETE
jgi:hypothetical protein